MSLAHSDVILAKATGSAGGLGKIAALASGETVYIRCDCSTQGYRYVDWNVQTTAKVDLGFYVARSIVDAPTITLDAIADTNTIVINGLTLTGKANAAAATAASRYFRVDGADNDADAVILAALINADYAVVTAGTSVAATDKLVVTTDEGAHTIVCAAAADYPAGKYVTGNAATELASLVLAINHRDTITVGHDTTTFSEDVTPTETAQDYALSIEMIADHNTHTALTSVHRVATAAVSSVAATTAATLIAQANVTREAMKAHYSDAQAHARPDWTNLALVNATTPATTAGTARTLLTALATAFSAHILTAKAQANDVIRISTGGVEYEYTGHATTTTAPAYACDGANASTTADDICTCLNDSTYGLPNATAVNATGAIGITRDNADTLSMTVFPAGPHVPYVWTAAGGVPGVIAVATGYAGELTITPTWTKVLTATESGDRLTLTDIDIPGVLATAGTAKVTLTPATPVGAGGERATLIQTSGTATRTVHSQAATLLGLRLVNAAGTAGLVADVAANNTTDGTIYTVPVNGYQQAYISVYADGTTPTLVVTATKRA